MALTVAQLAGALRLGDGTTDPAAPFLAILTRHLAVGTAMAKKLAPNAPEDVRDEAVVRLAGYMYDAPTAGARSNYAHGWRNSGAASLVEPWVSASAVPIEAAAAEASSSSSPSGPGIDQTARDAAEAAQQTADANATFLSTFAARVRAVVGAVMSTWTWAVRDNDDPIPSAKLTRAVTADAALSLTYRGARSGGSGFGGDSDTYGDGPSFRYLSRGANLIWEFAIAGLNEDDAAYLATLRANDTVTVLGETCKYQNSFNSGLATVLSCSRQSSPSQASLNLASRFTVGDAEAITFSRKRVGAVEQWAATGNADPIPKAKLTNASGGVSEAKAREIADEEVDRGIENGVQEWARAAPGNEDNEGNQIYAGADVYAPDAVGGHVLTAGRNNATHWSPAAATGLGIFRGSFDVSSQSDIPAYLTQQVAGERDGDIVAAFTSTTVWLYRYDSGSNPTWASVLSWSREGMGTARSDAQLEAFIERIVTAWAIAGNADPIPGSKTFDGLFKATGATPLPAANVTIQFAAGDNSKPDESLEETTAASTTFAITKAQAEASDAQLRVQWDLVRNTAEGQLPTDIELLLRDSLDNVLARHNVKDEGEGHATFPITKEGTVRWAVRVVTEGRYVGSLAITGTTYQSGDALADPSIRAVVHPIVSEEAEERQAQDAVIRADIARVEGLTAIVDALPEPDEVRDRVVTFSGDAQATTDSYLIPSTGFVQFSIPAIGTTPIIPVEDLTRTNNNGGTHGITIFTGTTSGGTQASISVYHHTKGAGGDNRATGFYVSVARNATGRGNWTDRRYFLIVRYWRPARASDGHTVSELASLETRVEKLEKKPGGASREVLASGTIAANVSLSSVRALTAADDGKTVALEWRHLVRSGFVATGQGTVATGRQLRDLQEGSAGTTYWHWFFFYDSSLNRQYMRLTRASTGMTLSIVDRGDDTPVPTGHTFNLVLVG